MDAALAWVGWIAEWFAKWVPKVEIVPTTHKAVKFRRGDEVIPLGPGVHVYWPLITEFRVYDFAVLGLANGTFEVRVFASARQAVDLRPQVLTLKDDKTVLLGALITYEIEDIEKALAHTWDIEESVKDSALSAATEVCAALTWPELKELQQTGKINIRLRASARNVLRDYGVNVIKMNLTDLALAKVYKLVQSNNTISR